MEVTVLKMRLAAEAENIARVRSEVEAEAVAAGMAAVDRSNLKTVVSEACSNACLYAYEEGEDGLLEILLACEGQEMTLTVRDFGAGIYPRPDSELPSLHMGLPLIGALSSSFRLSSTRGGGTELEVRMPMASSPTLD